MCTKAHSMKQVHYLHFDVIVWKTWSVIKDAFIVTHV